MRRRRATVVVLLALLAGCTNAPSERPDGPVTGSPSSEGSPRPDIVLVLMDDFSTELLQSMPEALRMRREGASYPNAFVVDSLCCPSRSALLTGRAPHQTGVLVNTPNNETAPIGGYEGFVAHGNERQQFARTLQEAGYTTGYLGKFLNGYGRVREDGRPEPVPGWDLWEPVLAGAYDGWGYDTVARDEDGELTTQQHPYPPPGATRRQRDHARVGHHLTRTALEFIREHRGDGDPYFLMVSTYAPHAAVDKRPGEPVFPPALRDRAPAGNPDGGNCGAVDCADLTVDDLAGHDDPRLDNAPTYLHRDGTTSPALAWRTVPIRMTEGRAERLLRDRARMVQSVDRMVRQIRDAVGENAYVVLTSDNGYHLGQHRLNGGKGTPYDTDTRVPLLVVGPDVVPGERTQYVNNIDLAPTFERLVGATPPDTRAGSSFRDSLLDPAAPGGRYVFFEHTNSRIRPGEIDADLHVGGGLAAIPSYVAVRSERGLLVRVDLDAGWTDTDHAWELYDYEAGFADRNIFAEAHDEPWARDLRRRLERWEDCAPAACRRLTR